MASDTSTTAGAATSSKDSATRKLRLRPLHPADLPAHPLLQKLQAKQSKPVDLAAFLNDVLAESVDFSDSVIPSTFHKRGSPKKSLPSTAKVQLFDCDLLRGEAWFARQSIHENAPLEGSANFEEFEKGLFDDHSKNEHDYTPSTFDAYKVLDWSEQIKAIDGESGEFVEVAMEIYEMGHQIPSPLSNRVFATLVVRGFSRPGAFAIAQIPVDISELPEAKYSNGSNRTKGETEEQRQKVVMGQYVSVERVREQADGNIVWETATASDAKGWLPMSLQKMALPGALCKDVGWFMDWTAKRRR